MAVKAFALLGRGGLEPQAVVPGLEDAGLLRGTASSTRGPEDRARLGMVGRADRQLDGYRITDADQHGSTSVADGTGAADIDATHCR